jgi:hypothetical protein
MSNWSKLKSKVTKVADSQTHGYKGKTLVDQTTRTAPQVHVSSSVKANYIGLDCEMVGIGPDGTQSALARCCLVDFDGKVVYDQFVRPPGYVTDFRTQWSGVRKKDLREGSAVSLLEVLCCLSKGVL